MQNFNLLRELGKTRKPVLLKRGHLGHHRGVAAFRRVHSCGWELRCDPVRARHPHVRNLHAQHHGYFRHSGGEEVVAPADDGGSVARDRTPRQGGAHGAGRGGGGRGRASGGGASRSRSRFERRRAIAAPGAVRGIDGAVADDRAGGGTQSVNTRNQTQAGMPVPRSAGILACVRS